MFQYIDLYHCNTALQYTNVNSGVKIFELDDFSQTDCQIRKYKWGYVLCESFDFRNPEIHGSFFADIWRRVEVGPNKPVRMFIAMRDHRVVGGCHLSLANGIATLFNVTTLKEERGKGIGTALSLAAILSAKELNYRYMVLQASVMGAPVYKKLGFKPIPSYKTFIKVATVAWYYKIIEMMLFLVGFQRLKRFITIIGKSSNKFLLIAVILSVIFGLLITAMLK